jgi:hypothetical protein
MDRFIPKGDTYIHPTTRAFEEKVRGGAVMDVKAVEGRSVG